MVRKPGLPVNTSVLDSLETYYRWHRIEGSTPVTLSHKRTCLGLFVKWLEAEGVSLELDSLTVDVMLDYIEYLRGRGIKPVSVDTQIRSLRAWCNWLVDWGYIIESPLARIKPRRSAPEVKGFISGDQFRALLDICSGKTLADARRTAMLWVLMTTGLRRRELIGLRYQDLDWDSWLIKVERGKGQKPRLVPLANDAAKALLRYVKERGDSEGPLWITEHGKPMTYDGVGEDVIKIMRKAHVKVRDPMHVFRRTWAANAERQGIPRQYIMAVAGWTKESMLAHYVRAMQQETGAVEAFRGYRVV